MCGFAGIVELPESYGIVCWTFADPLPSLHNNYNFSGHKKDSVDDNVNNWCKWMSTSDFLVD